MSLALLAIALQVHQATLDVQPIIRGRLNVSAHALWDPSTGKPLLVVPYAFTADAFIRPGDSVPVDLTLRVRDGRLNRGTTLPVMLSHDATRFVGYLVLQNIPQPGTWELTADLPSRHRDISRKGRAVPLDTTAIAMSDVVLGDSALATAIELGERAALLAPHETVPSDRPVEMYLQVRNTGDERDVRFDLRILRMINRNPLRSEVLALRTPLRLQPGINPVQRFLDLSRLDGSEYDIVATVLDEHGAVLARRVTSVLLRQDDRH
jgi:hypothetical protein